MAWTSTQLTTRGESTEFHTIITGEDQPIPPVCLPLLLPSNWFYHITFTLALSAQVSSSHTRSHSPHQTLLGKIRDKCQAYCTTYKTCAIATHQGGAGCPLDRGMDIHAEDPEHTNIDNKSTHSSDATVALGEPEAEEHPKDPVYQQSRQINSNYEGDKQLLSISSS